MCVYVCVCVCVCVVVVVGGAKVTLCMCVCVCVCVCVGVCVQPLPERILQRVAHLPLAAVRRLGRAAARRPVSARDTPLLG